MGLKDKNALRIIKIYNIKGKIHSLEEFMFTDLNPIVNNNCIIYYKNGEEYFEYIIHDNHLVIDYYNVYNRLIDEYSLSSDGIDEVVCYLFNKYYNIHFDNHSVYSGLPF